MVGLIQKLLFDMIKALGGDKAVLAVKAESDLPPDHEFQINTVYPDKQWQCIFAATLKVLNVTPEQGTDAYAKHFMDDVMSRFPAWFAMSKNSYEMLCLQPVIHNCFASSVLDRADRDTIKDKFSVEQLPGKIITHYCSPNQHCDLYIKLVGLLLQHYGDEATIEEVCCTKNGAPECQIHIEWSKLS